MNAGIDTGTVSLTAMPGSSDEGAVGAKSVRQRAVASAAAADNVCRKGAAFSDTNGVMPSHFLAVCEGGADCK